MSLATSPIYKPSKDPDRFYSGKEKTHILRYLVSPYDGHFIFGFGPLQGRSNDISLLHASGIYDRFDSNEVALGDGIFRHQPQFLTTVPTPRVCDDLTNRKAYNTIVSSRRMIVECAIGRIKKFAVMRDVFRGNIDEHNKIFFVVLNIAQMTFIESPLVRARPFFLTYDDVM